MPVLVHALNHSAIKPYSMSDRFRHDITYFCTSPGEPGAPAKPLTVHESPDSIDVDTGVVRCRIARKGASLIQQITRGDTPILENGRLVCLRQDAPGDADAGTTQRESFTSQVESVTVEQSGPVRTRTLRTALRPQRAEYLRAGDAGGGQSGQSQRFPRHQLRLGALHERRVVLRVL